MGFGRVIMVVLLGWLMATAGVMARPPELLSRTKAQKTQAKVSYQKDVAPLLTAYCYGCHGNGKKKGGVALDAYKDEQSITNQDVWAKVMQNLDAHIMPPEDKKQPSALERELIVKWIQTAVFKCDCDHPDPGRVTVRRLNRTEYNNTIRDLVGVDFQPADDFPQDDVGYGFDNIGDVLSMPPILLEKYLTAAESILNKAVVTELMPGIRTNQFDAINLPGSAPGESTDGGMRKLAREGDIYVNFDFLTDGEYILRVRAYGEQAGPEPARMAVSLDGKEIMRFDVPVTKGHPKVYEMRLSLGPGKRKFAAAYLNNYVNQKDPPRWRDRNLVIDYLEVVSPAATKPIALPESHKRIFVREPTPGTEEEAAREIIATFARRAYRRPPPEDDVDRLLKFFRMGRTGGENFQTSIKLALQAILVSPHFLFRGEIQPSPNDAASVHPVDDFSLASQLSYFLWSSMPDDQLFAEAGRGTLRKNLEAQVKRMLKDSKSRALVDNFAGQWLQIRNLSQAAPAPETYPKFDEPLRDAMEKETELFFENIIREDRSVLDFIDADYTFVNARLARHYGIEGIKGEKFQRVSLKGTPRGGILTHASILTITSNPTRTSPVKRGKWVLENILGTPPPPPPPDVPELKDEKVLAGTLRQRMEQHRANPNCAICHQRMDPIGFGFENFDGIGAWREKDGKSPIDPSGELVTGESFEGPAELRNILLKGKKSDFIRCLSEKMLTYGLGRGLEYYDRCALDQISKDLAKKNYRFSELITAIVKSTPFQMRRGEQDKTVASK
jgi:mono/diheme cytochrome c family protein